MHAAVVAVARAPRISHLASVAAVSIRGEERARARATLTLAASSVRMEPIVELYARVDETLPADPASTPADESHFRAIAPYMNAVEPRHLAMEPPSTSRRSSEDSRTRRVPPRDPSRSCSAAPSPLPRRAPRPGRGRGRRASTASTYTTRTGSACACFGSTKRARSSRCTTTRMTAMSKLLYGSPRARVRLGG